MIYLLSLLFIIGCLWIVSLIIKEFNDGYDWFSGALFFIVFMVSCGLLYVMIFGAYYIVLDFL
jgi:hypothetical protein